MGWAGLVKHGMGGADIQNKRGIFEGLARDHAGTKKSLLELGVVIFEGIEGIITFIRSHGLLAQSKNCAK